MRMTEANPAAAPIARVREGRVARMCRPNVVDREVARGVGRVKAR